MAALPRFCLANRGVFAPVLEPRVDNAEPPGKPPKLSRYGSYCFRAYTDMVSTSDNSNVIKEFTGFDDNLSIVDTVNKYCMLNKGKDETVMCNPTKLSFVGGQLDICDGRVIVFDTQTGSTQLFTSKPFFD